ncbi:MAG: hypothetical protein OXT06_08405, partial [Rhodospirillaceae bacterium]|nr:hypothetical protein [Rhodospirillaceae bacterium]
DALAGIYGSNDQYLGEYVDTRRWGMFNYFSNDPFLNVIKRFQLSAWRPDVRQSPGTHGAKALLHLNRCLSAKSKQIRHFVFVHTDSACIASFFRYRRSMRRVTA